MFSVLLLGSAPMLMLSIMPQGLWWLPGGPKRTRRLRAGIMVGWLGLAISSGAVKGTGVSL
jgi:hypothetical protein